VNVVGHETPPEQVERCTLNTLPAEVDERVEVGRLVEDPRATVAAGDDVSDDAGR
jgi:hypothetical protein